MADKGLLSPLTWESEFFQRSIGFLHVDALTGSPDSSEFAGYDLVEAKVPVDRLDLVDLLSASSFRLAETECVFAYTPATHRPATAGDLSLGSGGRTGYRPATAQDEPAVVDLAAGAFRFSRFRPPWFAQAETAGFYAAWARNAVRGEYDDECLLVETHGELVGLVTMKDNLDGSARIGLLAASTGSHGTGKGAALVDAARGWCGGRGIPLLRVATQLSNVRAVRLFARTGGQMEATFYWMYRRSDG